MILATKKKKRRFQTGGALGYGSNGVWSQFNQGKKPASFQKNYQTDSWMSGFNQYQQPNTQLKDASATDMTSNDYTINAITAGNEITHEKDETSFGEKLGNWGINSIAGSVGKGAEANKMMNESSNSTMPGGNQTQQMQQVASSQQNGGMQMSQFGGMQQQQKPSFEQQATRSEVGKGFNQDQRAAPRWCRLERNAGFDVDWFC